MAKTEEHRELEEEQCAGYEREPHIAVIALYRRYPDGHQDCLCKVCATRWLLSDDNWPPKNSQKKGKAPCLSQPKVCA